MKDNITELLIENSKITDPNKRLESLKIILKKLAKRTSK